MNTIRVLDEATVNQIAAGEVVERPSSVIKELVENSIDAGADRVTVEIRDGGKKLIRVTDNGCGIPPEDVKTAFLQHATSKIRSAEDLIGIASFGFRGEALSSISAVSRVEIITKRAEDMTATRYAAEGGSEIAFEEVGAPDGTTIIVRDLFFNTPAREKFLKTGLTESARAGSVIEQLILSNPGTAITFISDGREKLSSGGKSLKDAVYSVYGRDVTRGLIECVGDEAPVRINGFIGRPEHAAGTRNNENYYVNGRYVRSRIISQAIEDGYGTRLMQHRYPFTALFIEIDGDKVDVNVHPAKTEVRFSDEKTVYDAVRRAVNEALASKELIVEESAGDAGRSVPSVSAKTAPAGHGIDAAGNNAITGINAVTGSYDAVTEARGAASADTLREEVRVYSGDDSAKRSTDPASDKGEDGAAGSYDAAVDPEKTSARPRVSVRPPEAFEERAITAAAEASADTGEATDSDASFGRGNAADKAKAEQMSFLPDFISEEASGMRRIVGHVFSTYWIAEYAGKVYLFDQHAAHERVLYERFMREYRDRGIASQAMDPPRVISLTSRDAGILEEYGEAFSALGFEIEPFGGSEYAVRAVPYALGNVSPSELFMSLMSGLDSAPAIEDTEAYIHRVATEACKAAVKGGREISAKEAEKLLNDLMNCEDPYHCPHGRPTIISFTLKDIEKRFKRIV